MKSKQTDQELFSFDSESKVLYLSKNTHKKNERFLSQGYTR